MNRRLLFALSTLAAVGVVGLAAFFAVPAFAQEAGAVSLQEHEFEGEESEPLTAPVDIHFAAEAATDEIIGYARSAELGSENGTIAWEVEVVEDGTGDIYEVIVDATSGEVLYVEFDDEDDEDDGEEDEDFDEVEFEYEFDGEEEHED